MPKPRTFLCGARTWVARTSVACAGVGATLVGCATAPLPPAAACAAGEQAAVHELLYFGSATPDGPVSPQAWSAFLAQDVTPRFPGGLTVWSAEGQWRAADGSPVAESTRVLSLVYPAAAEGATATTATGPSAAASIGAIVATYKQRFRQEAVLRLRSPACLSF